MIFLTASESEKWWSDRFHGMSPNLEAAPPEKLAIGHIGLDDYPAQSLQSAGRLLTHWLFEHDDDSSLVWVREWGIWGSSENWHLYSLIRRFHGNHALLESTPGHLIPKHERVDLSSLIYLAMASGWGIAMGGSYGSRALWIDHDGHARAYAESPSIASDLLKNLSR